MRLVGVAIVLPALLAGCSTDKQQDRPAVPDIPPGYDWNRPDPRYGGYFADRYFRDMPGKSERPLQPADRIYRGEDGRYYCRRPDGTTGLIIGTINASLLDRLIPHGGSQTLGTLSGAGPGAGSGAPGINAAGSSGGGSSGGVTPVPGDLKCR